MKSKNWTREALTEIQKVLVEGRYSATAVKNDAAHLTRVKLVNNDGNLFIVTFLALYHVAKKTQVMISIQKQNMGISDP